MIETVVEETETQREVREDQNEAQEVLEAPGTGRKRQVPGEEMT